MERSRTARKGPEIRRRPDGSDAAAGAEEGQERLAADRTIAYVARSFVDRATTEFDGCVTEALQAIGELAGADRAFVYRNTLDGYHVDNTHEWCGPGAESLISTLQGVPLYEFAWWAERMLALEPLVIARLADLPDNAAPERAFIESLGVASFTVVPMVEQGRPTGFVGIDAVTEGRAPSPAVVSLLEQFAALLASAFGRRDADIARRESEAALRASESRFRRMVDNWPDSVLVIDDGGQVTFANPRVKEMFGYSADEIVGVSVFDLLHPDDVARAIDELAREIELGSDNHVEPVLLRARHLGGHWVPVEVTANNLLDDTSVAGVVINARDLSERERIAAVLREAEVRFSQVFEHAPIGMGLADLEGRFLQVNPSLCRMVGYTSDELVGMRFADLTHPDDRPRTREIHDRLVAGDLRDYTFQKRYLRKDGSSLWVRVNASAVRDEHGAPVYTIGQIEDITEHKQFEERLTHEATHDALTGLPGRKLLIDRLEQAIASSLRHGTQVGVLFIDLDHFKQINDSLGHAAGDELLALFARRLEEAVRQADTPSRFGGDEFVVVCPDLADPRDVVVVAERILAQLSRPLTFRDAEVFVGASIGVTVADEEADASTLLHQADDAAYRAKEKGRNRYEIFDEELRVRAATRLEVEAGLRHALDNDELCVRYEPFVETASGEIVGFEALVRWERPEHGLLLPAEFLEVAEDSGLVVPLGRAVLRAAVLEAAAWAPIGPPGRAPVVSVNVSPRQLARRELVDDVRRALSAAGLPPDRLCLEITETTLAQDTFQVIEVLNLLHDMGVRLALDDFGTGYSSLSYLRLLPVDIVKIDRSFIMELGADREGSMIVASVIELAHALGMQIVAEGVETAAHVASLRSLGCDLMQGYYFSPAIPAEAAAALARQRFIERGVA